MHQDRLTAIVARRASHAYYRGRGRYRRHLAHAHLLADSIGPVETPRLEDQIAVHLAHRLPDGLVAAMGVRGVRLAACVMVRPLVASARVTIATVRAARRAWGGTRA
ncbi:MAG: hypothetical protein KIS87_00870 [Phycisphaeraceae bacterium]|nr:hypothetical protein [Phycisphaeraceae bacterium]